MIYKDFQGEQLSALGLGCMRLPHTEKGYDDVDREQVRQMVAYAMEPIMTRRGVITTATPKPPSARRFPPIRASAITLRQSSPAMI